jgi:hypothetical protein
MSKGGGTQTSTSDIPAEYKQFANESLSLAGTIANTPFIPYQGQRIAGFNAADQSSFDQVASLPGQVQPSLDSARGVYDQAASGGLGLSSNNVAAGQVTGQTGAQNMSRYSNPYEQQVVQQTISDMGRANQINQNQLNATAAGAGAFGGSRHGVANAQMNRDHLDRVGAATSGLRAGGFNTAAGLGQTDASRFGQIDTGNVDRTLSAAQADEQRRLNTEQYNNSLMMQAAQGQQSLAQSQQNLGLTQAGAMGAIGQQQRAMDQTNADLAYGDWIEQANDPISKLSVRQAALGMTPMGSIQRTPVQSNAGGLLSGVGSIIGGMAAFGGCYVARECFGEDNPIWRVFRWWMLNDAPVWFRKLYLKHGEAFAGWISDKPRIKAVIRRMMLATLDSHYRQDDPVRAWIGT